MADLNTNQYLYKQPYLQNQPNFSDNKIGLPTSLDDKRLDPVKDNLKTGNPIGKTAEAFIGDPINIAIGTVPFLAIDRLLKWLPKGQNLNGSNLGKLIGHIDNFSNKLPKFDWLRKTYANLKDTNFIKQIINANPAKPRFSLAKSQVTPSKTTILTQLIDEVVEITGKDGKIVKGLKNAIENPEKAEKLLRNFSEKAANKPQIAERFLRRYGKILDLNEFKKAAETIKKGGNVYNIAYESALNLAGKNPSERLIALRNRAQFFMPKLSGEHSGISKVLMSIYNNMTTFLTTNVKFKPGIENLSGNAAKLGGTAFMLFMGANVLGKIIKNTWDAPKGEKISTLAHSTITDLGSWLMMLPIGIFMYKGIGSLKNLQGGNLISRAIKAPLRGLGTLLSTGLKTVPKAGLGKIANAFKRVGGGSMRFLLFAMVLSPLVDKLLRFAAHSIFGKPNALLAKEKAEAEKEAENGKPASSDADNLKKALELNKAEMITVAAKNQQNSSGNTSPMIEKYLKSHVENLNKTSVTNSVANTPLESSNVKPVSAQEIDQKQQYVPADTRKTPLEDQEKKMKFNTTLAATDKAIEEAEKALGSK